MPDTHFSVADGRCLPLAANSADVVRIANVLGLSGYGLSPFGYPFPQNNGKFLLDFHESDQIIEEVRRILKSCGEAHIIETITPPNIENVIQSFSRHGFILRKTLKRGDGIEKLVAHPAELIEPTSYALIFQLS